MLGQQQQSQTQIGVNSYISADEQNGYIAKEQQNIASLQQAAAMLQQQMTPAALKGMSQQDVQALIPINNQAAASINIQLIKSQQRLLALQSGPLTLVNLSKLYAN
jgi:ribosomal protein S2